MNGPNITRLESCSEEHSKRVLQLNTWLWKTFLLCLHIWNQFFQNFRFLNRCLHIKYRFFFSLAPLPQCIKWDEQRAQSSTKAASVRAGQQHPKSQIERRQCVQSGRQAVCQSLLWVYCEFTVSDYCVSSMLPVAVSYFSQSSSQAQSIQIV